MKSRKPSTRRRAQRSVGSTIAAQSLTNQFQRQLGVRNDAITVKSKSVGILTFSNTGGTVTQLEVIPSNFSGLVAAMAPVYTRWRLLKLIVSWKSGFPTSSQGRTHIGILDDVTADEGTPPTTTLAVSQCRAYSSEAIYRDNEVEWKPLRNGKPENQPWLFLDIKAGDELRTQIPCTVLVAFDATQTGTSAVDMYYTLQFSGQGD